MTTITLNNSRDQLLAWLKAGQAYPFLTAADPFLDESPDDSQIRLLAVREYLNLGLVRPARELLEANVVGRSEQAEALAGVRDCLATVDGGEVAWSTLADRFEANLSALFRRGFDVKAIRESWEKRLDQYELFRDRHGTEQVRRRDPAGLWRWAPFLGDHRALAKAQEWAGGSDASFPGPFLFEGVDLGFLFERVYRLTLDSFLGYSCALFVVEPDPAVLAVALHLHDWQAILSDPRVFLFLGERCTEQFRESLEQRRDLPVPLQAFTHSGFRLPCRPGAVEVAREVAAVRDRNVRASFSDLETRYRGRDLVYWARRFGKVVSGCGKPLRVLAAVSTHTTFLQHSMRDIRRALEVLGHQCVVLTENTPYEVISPLTYHEAIRELDPDLFFNIDHLRPEFGVMVPTRLPILTWDQDQLPHVFTTEHIGRIAVHDFVAGCSKTRFVRGGGNPAQFLPSLVPTCPEQFRDESLGDEEMARYACDVSFVSHASQTPLAFHEQERSGLPHGQFVKLLDAMYEQTCAVLPSHRTMRSGLPARILEEASLRTGVWVRDEAMRERLTSWYLWRLGDRIFRHEALTWVAEWARRRGRTFRIYGNGWDTHPTLSEFAAGPAENGHELLCVYRASKINLQLMPAGFLHPRALDGLAAGGFFLSRLVPHDLLGRTLRSLHKRITELALCDTKGLLNSGDPTLQKLLRAFCGDWLDMADPHFTDLYDYLQITAELPFADEVFPRFREIVFDSAEEFATAADRFLADGPARRGITEEMRRVVVEQFSYRATIRRFLGAMADYLDGAAGNGVTGNGAVLDGAAAKENALHGHTR